MTGMRVAVIGKSEAPGTFASHIAQAFREGGHEAIAIGIQPRWERTGRSPGRSLAANLRSQAIARSSRIAQQASRNLLKTLEAHRPDFVVTTLASLGPHLVEAIKVSTKRAPIVLWFPDAISNLGNQLAFESGFDRIYVKDPYLVDRLRPMGFDEARYLPEGAPKEALQWDRRRPSIDENESLCLVGNIYPSRVRFLLQLLDAGIELEIHGRQTAASLPPEIKKRFSGRYLSGDDKYEVFGTRAGVLNNLHYAEVQSVNYRLFEAAASGGLVLVEDLPQVSRYFKVGEEVMTYRSPTDIVRTLEIPPLERTRVKALARKRVESDHLIVHRLEVMLDDLGLSR